MPVRIRLQRHGKKGKPYYWVVAADARSKRDGKFLEKLGSYNPNTNPATIELNIDNAVQWLVNGAQPSDTARRILSYKGVLYKHHLLGGVRKGALTEEQAEAKFNAWVEEKTKTIAKKEAGLDKEKAEAKAKALEAEKEVNEKRALAAEEALNEDVEAEITEEAIVVTEEAGAETEATEKASAVTEEPEAEVAVAEEVVEEAAPVAEEVVEEAPAVAEEEVAKEGAPEEEVAKEAATAKAEDAAAEGDTEEKPAASDKKK
ncbi:30S ribosomal protein S16 [uncultured Eudoraea sp.]|uniref:30S ribosomal protein S16 n=1 Tax=uncultured Eudoraea sp. TaxID=1035614 RepID=UPI0026107362|nr:30S ribosomal protein S16 [uncultured Eudoraea sp.]